MLTEGNKRDRALVDRLKQGDKVSFELIFTKYYSTLCAYARLYLADMQTCENVVSDLMLWLWENRAEVRISESLQAYLFTATRNRCLKEIAHEMVERRVLGEIRMRMSERFETPDFYIVKELEERINAAVEQLPDTYREAFVKNRFERKTYAEIAAELGVSPKTIDYRIQQSLKILREELKHFLPVLVTVLMMSGEY